MRIEKLKPARIAAGCGPDGLLASNGAVSKRDLYGSFNQIRIADPHATRYRARKIVASAVFFRWSLMIKWAFKLFASFDGSR
jgi:hypothetical protein